MSFCGKTNFLVQTLRCSNFDLRSGEFTFQVPENLSLSSKHSLDSHHHPHSKESPILKLKQQQQQQQTVVGSYSLHSTPSNSPLLSQRHPVPIIGHKALNVPPTPSPDSAIHSAYSVFSSPNQSPLTQRHITLTPNLSRNNSDASHSSCCSYSSVSVSVSPTQQFSPTHSPIQVKKMHQSKEIYKKKDGKVEED